MKANPAEWNLTSMKQAWEIWVDNLIKDSDTSIPKSRVIIQTENNPRVQELFLKWESLEPQEKVKHWKELLSITEKEFRNPLPTCVQCGECCKKGSPTLYVDDIELLKEGKIPWKALVTLRKGEPVRNPLTGQAFFLIDERIKLREKPGTNECIFLNPDDMLCTIYDNRPLQCRAQACWDISSFKQLEDVPYLTRRDIFTGVDILEDIISEHEKRCSFEKLHILFKSLEKDKTIANQIIEFVCFETHFRNFMATELNIPEDTKDLIFGRSLESLLPLFGCRLETDGNTKYLKVIEK